ncbi:hypothetical protein AX774_g837 [Zancudomyces culisetae]|uniref:Uncharacterized protein n=1 Tax=Zancudomyces culisetae TaxID=1213189 RepID=A0A1R1PXE3_ZANCU|nr:hypothetical protein AX774_g837 [Zancudomyces culisetae]|eukprot:OMH85603.1 hypothetical protein AX774_g837 [Zancudomyces culisetae]
MKIVRRDKWEGRERRGSSVPPIGGVGGGFADKLTTASIEHGQFKASQQSYTISQTQTEILFGEMKLTKESRVKRFKVGIQLKENMLPSFNGQSVKIEYEIVIYVKKRSLVDDKDTVVLRIPVVIVQNPANFINRKSEICRVSEIISASRQLDISSQVYSDTEKEPTNQADKQGQSKVVYKLPQEDLQGNSIKLDEKLKKSAYLQEVVEKMTRKVQETEKDFIFNKIREITNVYEPTIFVLKLKNAEVANVKIFRTRYQFGDRVLGTIEFRCNGGIGGYRSDADSSRDSAGSGSISRNESLRNNMDEAGAVYQVSIYLESYEQVGEKFGNMNPEKAKDMSKTITSEYHTFCRGYKKLGFCLSTATVGALRSRAHDGAPRGVHYSFESDLLTIKYQLRIQIIVQDTEQPVTPMLYSPVENFGFNNNYINNINNTPAINNPRNGNDGSTKTPSGNNDSRFDGDKSNEQGNVQMYSYGDTRNNENIIGNFNQHNNNIKLRYDFKSALKGMFLNCEIPLTVLPSLGYLCCQNDSQHQTKPSTAEAGAGVGTETMQTPKNQLHLTC